MDAIELSYASTTDATPQCVDTETNATSKEKGPRSPSQYRFYVHVGDACMQQAT